MTVEVEKSDGTKTMYWDSVYACRGMGRKFVDMIDQLMSTLRTLSSSAMAGPGGLGLPGPIGGCDT
ncbi:MAG TPA: hypothetical protein VFH73_01380 [Polyangia bacterium]|nr:hypothetical protein [Polyangia bacterium]